MPNNNIQNATTQGGSRLENWAMGMLTSPDPAQDKLHNVVVYYPDSGAANPVPTIAGGVVTLSQKDATAAVGGKKVSFPYADVVPGSVVVRASTNAAKQVLTLTLPASVVAAAYDGKGAWLSVTILAPESYNNTPKRERQYQIYITDVATYNVTTARDQLLATLVQDPYSNFVAAASSTNAITITDYSFTEVFRVESNENVTVAVTTPRAFGTYKWNLFTSAKLPAEVIAAEGNPNKAMSAIEFEVRRRWRETGVKGQGSETTSDNAEYVEYNESFCVLFDPAAGTSLTAYNALLGIFQGATITAAADVTALKAAVLPYVALA